MLIGMIIAVTFRSDGFGKQIHSVGTAAQGNFPKRRKIFHGKEILCRTFGLNRPINISRLNPFDQFLRLNIHKLDLTCIIKYRIGNALMYHNARYRCNGVIKALDMLNIYRGINIYSRIKQLFNILITLCMPAHGGIGMSKLIHKNQLRTAGKGCIKIEFRKSNSVIFRNKIRKAFQSVYKCGGLRTGVWFDVTGNDINTASLC